MMTTTYLSDLLTWRVVYGPNLLGTPILYVHKLSELLQIMLL